MSSVSSRFLGLIVRVLAVVVALIFGAILVVAQGGNPLQVYYAMASSALGTSFGLQTLTTLMAILVLTALSAVVGFKQSIWNIGQEGYVYAGAIGGAGVALFTGLGLIVVLVVSALAGALWSLLAGVLKVKFKIDEIVSTILLNFVIILVVDFLTSGPWKGKATFGAAITDTIVRGVRLTSYVFNVNTVIIISVAVAVCTYVLLEKTKLGFEISLVGDNTDAARYCGIDIGKTTLINFALSGALGGLGGGILLTSVSFSLFDGVSGNYGWLGIAVALVGGSDALGSLPAALVFGVLLVGNVGSLASLNIPISFSQSIAAVIIIVFPIYPIIERRLRGLMRK